MSKQYLIELVEWHSARWPQHRVKWEALLEQIRSVDLASFEGNSITAERYYETECDLIIDPPDPDYKTGSDWVSFI